jgi:hypothetical protein
VGLLLWVPIIRPLGRVSYLGLVNPAILRRSGGTSVLTSCSAVVSGYAYSVPLRESLSLAYWLLRRLVELLLLLARSEQRKEWRSYFGIAVVESWVESPRKRQQAIKQKAPLCGAF